MVGILLKLCCSYNYFPKFFKILDPPFDFIVTKFVWIPELYFFFATNFDFEVDLMSTIFYFISEVEWSKNYKFSWLCNLAFFYFYYSRSFVED